MATLATLLDAGYTVRYGGGIGVNTGDIVVQTTDASRFDEYMLMSTAGAMAVFVTIDGTNYTTAPLSLIDLGATSTAPVLLTVALRMYAFFGNYKFVQVQQTGATAVTGATLMMSRKGNQF
ncbi:MAG: hypothetical protein ACRETH_09025 [Steroidobacteraceae bacterium]